MKGKIMRHPVFRRPVFVLTLMALCIASIQSVRAADPPRLRRADSFLGVHFDFHAGMDCTDIGKNVTPKMVNYILDTVKPDYVQHDCKGHAGITSWPTKTGTPAPGFVRDPLRIWRDETAKRGVALYMHYSGIFDRAAIAKHPEWARIDAEGKPDPDMTSVFGGYVDGLLIPQVEELIDTYGVDGIWIDGEAWAARLDYTPSVVDRFRKETGAKAAPKKPGEPYWQEWLAFNRQGFRDYIRHYTDTLHAYAPDFQITSNWAFTSMMPEPVSIDLDFLSADFNPQNSVNTARLEARCLAPQGKPWDLISWNFTSRDGGPCYTTKSPAQLEREVAITIALGGGIDVYFPQNRDASVRLWQMKPMAEVAAFARARQPFCHKAEPVHQVALLYSTANYYRTNPQPFAALDKSSGFLECLLDGGAAVEVVMEHHLAGRMADWPLIVVPEVEYLEPAFVDELLDYVRNGGNLLLAGASTAALFGDNLGVRFEGEPRQRLLGLEHSGMLGAVNTRMQLFTPLAGTEVRGPLYDNNDIVGEPRYAASVRALGKGRIAALPVDLDHYYADNANWIIRDTVADLVRELFPDPLVTVDGSHYVDLIPMRKDGRLSINLINTEGPHSNQKVNVFDEIAPVGPLTVTIRLAERPARIVRQPAGEVLPFDWAGGRAVVVLPRLEIHDVLVVEE